MAPPAPPPANSSSFQHVEFQNSDENRKPVPKKARRVILNPPSTTLSDTKVNMSSLAQISQDLKILAKPSINNKISIPYRLNIKGKWVNWNPCVCAHTLLTIVPNLFCNNLLLRDAQSTVAKHGP